MHRVTFAAQIGFLMKSILLILGLFWAASTAAQPALHLLPLVRPADSLARPALSLPRTPPFGYQVLPRFAQENPRGYSYLCRLELEVAETLPLGLWVKMEGGPAAQMLGSAHLRLQFRLRD